MENNTLDNFIQSLGFKSNPFEHSNADKESSFLEDYFIYPDYFEDIWGNPYNPTSNIIYAPRGGGKTAQRIIFEKRAKEIDDLLVITYTEHDLTKFESIDEININYHFEYLNRLLLISFFDILHTSKNNKVLNSFDRHERNFLFKISRIYLYNTPNSFPRQAINSLKRAEDRIREVWKNFKSPINGVIKKISKSKGFEIDISKIKIDDNLKYSHRDNFFNIKQFIHKIGIKSIYILVDKVDEQNLTGNDAFASYKLISSLIKDLELMDSDGLGFKFFLWDEIRMYCAKDARTDRIFSYSYQWKFDDLIKLINLRVSAYSNNRVEDVNSLFLNFKCLGRIIVFSEDSPRDMIRIFKRIISEHYKLKNGLKRISLETVNFAINKFCRDKSLELLKGHDIDLKIITRFNSASFTVEKLIAKGIMLDKKRIELLLNQFQSYGLLSIINQSINDENQKINEYAFTDCRISRTAFKSMSLDDFIRLKIRDCKTCNCGKFAYRDFEEKVYQCVECSYILNDEKNVSEGFREIKPPVKHEFEFKPIITQSIEIDKDKQKKKIKKKRNNDLEED